MSDEDVQRIGLEYAASLEAVADALHEIGGSRTLAAEFVAGLARRGFFVERAGIADTETPR